MKVIKRIKKNNIANVYIGETDYGKLFEFVESIQPPLSIRDKWVLIVSTLFGCPVNCKFCDAGGNYKGKLSYEEIMFQIDYLIKQRFPDKNVNTKKFKIQFARMGEPAFNNNVLDVLEAIPELYSFKNFIPSLSSVAPAGTDFFFKKLLDIKTRYYNNNFQLQFSLHSTDKKQRDELMPIKKWDFKTISEYGNSFYETGNRKITLNFALSENSIVDISELEKHFNPDIFLIKITPVNPTFKAKKNKINSLIKPGIKNYTIIENLKKAGYEVILSIGELEENKIGSNCGQYINALKNSKKYLKQGYTYQIEEV
jgi:23S rRNA (adenine2503-C2)-methyltransferase